VLSQKCLFLSLPFRLRALWRKLDGADPRKHAQKLAIYHAWMTLPLKPSNVRGPPHLLSTRNPNRYLELDLSRHVLLNIACFRLRAHTLRIEIVCWQIHNRSVTNVTCMMPRTRSMSFFYALAQKCAIREGDTQNNSESASRRLYW